MSLAASASGTWLPTSCSASAIRSLAIGLTMCTPSTRGTSGASAIAPLTMVMDPPSPLMSIRELDSIGYAVSCGSTMVSRDFASLSVSPTLAASGKENTTCGTVSSTTGLGSSPAMVSAMVMPCSNARCAKACPGVISPKAHTPSTFARPYASVRT